MIVRAVHNLAYLRIGIRACECITTTTTTTTTSYEGGYFVLLHKGEILIFRRCVHMCGFIVSTVRISCVFVFEQNFLQLLTKYEFQD